MSEILEFEAWPKIPRLNRGMYITEKIDGTNACVIITDDGLVGAQSRTRLITPEQDNYGFAGWVKRNEDALRDILGPGRHFGEWWGSGIQRKYGLTGDQKRFSLFNTSRWCETDFSPVKGLGMVPLLATGNFSTQLIEDTLADLKRRGSAAAPGFMDPEGIVVYLSSARAMFKVTVKNDEVPKGQAGRELAVSS